MMTEQLWGTVDDYLIDVLVQPDEALNQALSDSAAAGLPAISVTGPQGKFLHLLARIHGAKRILEVGTLGGFSTIWLARALPPGGKLITLEIDPKHAEVARKNLLRAGVADRVELILGKASDTLAEFVAQKQEPFDLIFIDADKPSNPEYFQYAMQLSRPGSVIVVDNVIRKGAVADSANDDPNVQGVRKLNELIAKESRVDATALQTVGGKGYDGFALILVK